MNREEAKLALEKGERVNHPSQPIKWWIEQDGKEYKCENGHVISIEDFWKYREGEDFDKDWSIIEYESN